MPGRSHHGPLPQATSEEEELAARLKLHVTAIASEPRNVRHYAALENAAAYIERTLAAEGYSVNSQLYDIGRQGSGGGQPVDWIWGAGLAADDPRVLNPAEWPGINLLGFALMKVRDILRAGSGSGAES